MRLQRAFVGTRPAVVLHLATPRGSDEAARARILEATVTGAIHLLRLAREFDVQRLVAAGSSLEYRPSDVALTEDACTEPTTIHGAAKAAATQLYRQAAVEAGVPVCVLRFFHVYGPWESRHRLLPTAIRAALAGTPLPLTGGAIARDWVFVADVVDAVLRAAGLHRNGEVINVGSGQEYSNEAIVQCVADTIGKPVRIVTGAFPRGPADVAHRRARIAARPRGSSAGRQRPRSPRVCGRRSTGSTRVQLPGRLTGMSTRPWCDDRMASCPGGANPDVTIVVPVYRNAATLPALAARVRDAMDGAGLTFRLLLVVDASPDESWSIVRQLASADTRIAGLLLGDNVGQHAAVLAGLASADCPLVRGDGCRLAGRRPRPSRTWSRAHAKTV